MEIPSTCRECGSEGREGVYWIPSSNQYGRKSDVESSHRPIEAHRVIYYCNTCFVKRKVAEGKDRCTHCHVSTSGNPMGSRAGADSCVGGAKLYHGMITIKDNRQRMDYYFASNSVPLHLQGKGKLCSTCVEALVGETVIRRRSRTLTSDSQCYKCQRHWNPTDTEDFPPQEVVHLFPGEMICEWNLFIDSKRMINSRGEMRSTRVGISAPSYPVSICNVCVKGLHQRALYTFHCDICLKKYDSWWSSYQADGICSSVSERGVWCGYESKYDSMDGEHFIWLGGVRPTQYKHIKRTCDLCLDQLVRQGHLKYLEWSNDKNTLNDMC